MNLKENQQERLLELINKVPNDCINKGFFDSIAYLDTTTTMTEIYLILGADPNQNDNCAMDIAAEFGNLTAIKLLHKYGGDINIDLSLAIKAGHTEVIKYMIKNGVEINLQYLKLAIECEEWEIAKLLLNYLPNVSKEDMECIEKHKK